MLEIIQTQVPAAAFRVSDHLTGEDYDRMVAEIERQLKTHERIAIYADFTALSGLRHEALLKDLRYSLSKLGELRRFARLAVVSDSMWLRAWAQLAWSLVPTAELRAFPSAERDAALTWATTLEEPSAHHGLTWIATNRPGTYAFAWRGALTDDDVDTVIKKLETEFESHESVRVLARIEHMGSIAPHILFRSALIRLKALGLRKVERYAIVGGPSWIGTWGKAMGQVTGIEMRQYPLTAEADAWAWLEAQPQGGDDAASASSHTV